MNSSSIRTSVSVLALVKLNAKKKAECSSFSPIGVLSRYVSLVKLYVNIYIWLWLSRHGNKRINLLTSELMQLSKA